MEFKNKSILKKNFGGIFESKLNKNIAHVHLRLLMKLTIANNR